MAAMKDVYLSFSGFERGNTSDADSIVNSKGELTNMGSQLDPNSETQYGEAMLYQSQLHYNYWTNELSASFTSKINLEPNAHSRISFIPPNVILNFSSIESNISMLSLANMNLSELPDNFERFTNLSEANFSMNSLSSLPPSFCTLSKLLVVNLSHNKFVDPPLPLYNGLYLVRDLDLSYNSLNHFNIPPLCLAFLKTLKLNNNALKCPPLWLFRDIPSSIEFLDLSNNPLLSLEFESDFIAPHPAMVSNKITQLFVSNCGLNEINTVFLKHFSNLKILRLGNDQVQFLSVKSRGNSLNSFQDLPIKNLPSTKSLEELYVQYSFMSSLIDEISLFISLKVLDIICNDINWFPNSVCSLKELRVLRACECELYFLPEELGDLLNLQELYLAHNQLSSLPESFKSLQSLEVLDLYDNNLSNVPDLRMLKKLRALDICLNNVDLQLEITVNEENIEYTVIQEALRSRLNLTEPRSNERREIATETSSNYNSEYSSRNSSLGNSSDLECCTRDGSEDENWDIEVLEDDNFDPNVAGRLTQQYSSSNESLTKIPLHLKERSHYFCPYQKQVQFWGTQRHFNECVDGQFDDT